MILSKRCTYGTRALLELAKVYPEGLLSTRAISEKAGIPRKFLDQLLLQLKKTGIVRSKQGSLGGYSLTMNPDSLRMNEVIEALNGPLVVAECLEDEHPCRKKDFCQVNMLSSNIKKLLDGYLNGLSLRDLAEMREKPTVSYDI